MACANCYHCKERDELRVTLREIQHRINAGGHPGSLLMQIMRLIDRALRP